MFLEEMGNRIKSYRQRLGFTQQDLASALQVSPQAVSKWERGENAPDITVLPALSEVLGLSVDSLVGSNWRERKTVEATIVFADMMGYGPLARSNDAAGLAIALNAFFYPLTEHLVARDGIPIKYIGDELLCLFAGEGHSERAFRAVFAALEASPRKMRVSVTTGPVWMGPIGHPLYARPDVIGEAVNLGDSLHRWLKESFGGGGSGAGEGGGLVAANEAAVAPCASRLRLGRSDEIGTWAEPSKVRVFEVLGLAD